jgi:phosphatidylglycerophosphatase C
LESENHAEQSTESKPCVAIFDLDGTITTKNTYTPFILSVVSQHPWRYVFALPILIAVVLYKGGLLSRATLKEIMLRAALGRVSRETLQGHVDRFVTRCLEVGVRPGAFRAIESHKAAGDRLILATASFAFYAEEIGRRLGFDSVVATGCRWDGDQLSCRLSGDNCRGPSKLVLLEPQHPELKSQHHVVAYSDHHVDMPLLRWADSGVAVNPTMRLRKAAGAAAFSIVDWDAT